MHLTIKRIILPQFQIVSHLVVLSQISLVLDKFIKMHKHLQHQTTFIRYIMKYTLIVHLFDIADINIFLYKLGQS
jgi:hypothetical protein